MTNQQKFQLHVYLGAIRRDMDNNTNDAQWVTAYAERIPLENIPANPKNAATVYLRFVTNQRSEPFKWMLPKKVIGEHTRRACRVTRPRGTPSLARARANAPGGGRAPENVIKLTFNPS